MSAQRLRRWSNIVQMLYKWDRLAHYVLLTWVQWVLLNSTNLICWQSAEVSEGLDNNKQPTVARQMVYFISHYKEIPP